MSKTIHINLKQWHKVPVTVRRFIISALIMLAIWKLLYLLWLLPTRLLDRPLSYIVGQATTWLLNICTHTSDFTQKSQLGYIATDTGPALAPLEKIYFRNWNVVAVEDSCNGLELMVLYVGFIICMPAALKRKLVFSAIGLVAIYMINVLRCAAVAYIIIYYPKYADFAHHYVLTFMVYGVIIALWLIFVKKLNLAHAQTK